MNTAVFVAVLLVFCPPAWWTTAGAHQRSDSQALPVAEGAVATTVAATYALGPSDQIVIRALDVPDITDKPQRLDPNGDLKLPLIGRVHAAGLTLEQLERELRTRLKVYLEEPDVSVALTELHSQPVSVIGAVSTSGIRQLEGEKTLIEVLSMAGGTASDAGPTVRITRRLEWGRIPLPGAMDDPSGLFSAATIDLHSLLSAQHPDQNIVIRPYDVISVPRAESVFVVGEVAKPGSVMLSGQQSMSVIEAVSSSGGVLRTASPGNARILRRVAGAQTRSEVSVDLKKIMQGRAPDPPLLPGDILVVPDSGGQRALQRAVETAIQVGTILSFRLLP